MQNKNVVVCAQCDSEGTYNGLILKSTLRQIEQCVEINISEIVKGVRMPIFDGIIS